MITLEITVLGLFPSLEQLQLLSLLVDNKVDLETIQRFWDFVVQGEWGLNGSGEKDR